jgi:hypothetical protein
MQMSVALARVGHDSPEELLLAGRALMSGFCGERNVLLDFGDENPSDGQCNASGILIILNEHGDRPMCKRERNRCIEQSNHLPAPSL